MSGGHEDWAVQSKDLPQPMGLPLGPERDVRATADDPTIQFRTDPTSRLGPGVGTVDGAEGGRSRRRVSVTVLVVLLVVALAAGIGLAVLNVNNARRQHLLAVSRRLEAQSASLNASDHDLALLLAVQAWRFAPTAEARSGALSLIAQSLTPGRHAPVVNVGTVEIGRLGTSEAAAFSPDGRTLAAAVGDGTVRLWDVAGRRPLGAPLTGHSDAVNAVAFSPDGKVLVSGGDDRTVRLWDVAGHRQLGDPLTGHHDAVNAVAFSPDRKMLVSGSDDHTVRLWDVAGHRQLGDPLTGHRDSVSAVAFNPDSKILASAGDDKTVRRWSVLIPAEVVSAACSAAGRSMTRDEWAHYLPDEPYRSTC